MQQIERDFLGDNTCRVTVSVGTKGSGKTHLMLAYVKFALRTRRFDSLHLVLPSFSNEEDDSYKWLTEHNNVYIYTQYSPVVTERVIKAATANAKAGKQTFFALDDATHNGVDLSIDHEFLELITTSRHKKVSVWLIFHSLRAVINPVIRANIDYMFIFRISNNRLLTALYEEYFSMFKEFASKPREFSAWYVANVLEKEYGCLFLSTLKHVYTVDVPSWQVLTLLQ